MSFLIPYFPLASTVAILISAGVTIYLFRISRAISYIERLQNRDFIESRLRLDFWLASETTIAMSTEQRIAAIEADKDLQLSIRWMLNFLQEIAVGYRYGLIHHKITYDLFDFIVLHYWEQLEFWVIHCRRRRSNADELYRRLEWLYGRYKQHKNRERTAA